MQNLAEAGGAREIRLASHDDAARVRDFQAQRQTVEIATPVLTAYDRRGADLLAGSVNSAIGEQVSGERAAVGVALHAAHVEAREIQRAVTSIEWQERAVATASCE